MKRAMTAPATAPGLTGKGICLRVPPRRIAGGGMGEKNGLREQIGLPVGAGGLMLSMADIPILLALTALPFQLIIF